MTPFEEELAEAERSVPDRHIARVRMGYYRNLVIVRAGIACGVLIPREHWDAVYDGILSEIRDYDSIEQAIRYQLNTGC